MGVYFNFSIGRAGASAANVRYITREPATAGNEQAIITHNFPEYAREGASYKEQQRHLVEYVRQKEEDELLRPQRGKGERQTHYRAIASFEKPVSTEVARQHAQEYLQKAFPHARAIAVVHQDREHTHIHFHIQARDIEGQKMRFSQQQWRNLDQRWCASYAKSFGAARTMEHQEKKREMREYKQAMARGEEQEMPRRFNRVDKRQMYRERERNNAGHDINESRADRIQREFTNGKDRAQARERTITQPVREPGERVRELTPAERAIEQYARERERGYQEVQRADQAVERGYGQSERTLAAGRGALQSFERAVSGVEERVRSQDQQLERATIRIDRSLRELNERDQRQGGPEREIGERTDRFEEEPGRKHEITRAEREASRTIQEFSRAVSGIDQTREILREQGPVIEQAIKQREIEREIKRSQSMERDIGFGWDR